MVSVGAKIAAHPSAGWPATSRAKNARLERDFPDGVCDYTKPDVGKAAGWR
jgi:hypothetical protein